MYDRRKCEKIKLSQGFIYLGPSDKERSVGYLELKPKQSLVLHNRPVVERLVQVGGTSNIVIYDSEEGRTVKLRKGDEINIPAEVYHIHANPYDKKSLTYWDFEGDIREIIKGIRAEVS